MGKISIEYFFFGITNGFTNTQATEEEFGFIRQFYNGNTNGTKIHINKRYNDKVYYTYIKGAENEGTFRSQSGRPGSFLGITVGFDAQYCKDFTKIERLFEKSFENLEKLGIIKQTSPGEYQFMIGDFGHYEKQTDAAFSSAMRHSGLTHEDLAPFKFNGLKGTHFCNIKDAPRLQYLMRGDRNLTFSDQYVTSRELLLQTGKTRI